MLQVLLWNWNNPDRPDGSLAAHKCCALWCCFALGSETQLLFVTTLQVLLWNWNNPDRPDGSLVGHSHPVVCVEMSLDKTSMVSGDKNGTVVIWDAVALIAKQVRRLGMPN